MKKFLLIQTAFIGDAILATAVLEKLHQSYPKAQIDVVFRKGNEVLLENHPFVHHVFIWNKKNEKYQNLFKLIQQIRKEKYDWVINLQRFLATGLLTVLSNAKNTVGFDKNPLSVFFTKRIKHNFSTKAQFVHEVDRNLALVKHLTDTTFIKPKLYPPELDSFQRAKKYICIAPASVWATKQLPFHKWLELIRKIDGAISIYLLGAPSDGLFLAKIIKESKHPDIQNLAGKLSLLQSAALMKDALMNYVNDSAPLHLASAVNAPVTAFYCSTIPAFGFTPLSDVHFIKETTEKLNCRPCGLHGLGACPLGHFKCGEVETK